MATMYEISKQGKLINPVEVPEKSEPLPVRLNRLVGCENSECPQWDGGCTLEWVFSPNEECADFTHNDVVSRAKQETDDADTHRR
jgi:hypothetical protein